jgi:hypothetical protein
MALLMISCRDKIVAEEENMTIAQSGRVAQSGRGVWAGGRILILCRLDTVLFIAGPAAAESGGCDGNNPKERRDNDRIHIFALP